MKYGGKYSLKAHLLTEGDLNEGFFEMLGFGRPELELDKFDKSDGFDIGTDIEAFDKAREEASKGSERSMKVAVTQLMNEREREELEERGLRKVRSWEDLRVLLRCIIHSEELKLKMERAKNEVSGAGLLIKGILAIVLGPIMAAFMGAFGLIKDTKEFIKQSVDITNKEKDNAPIESNKALDAFLLDVGYSQMLDPKIEIKMLKAFLVEIEGEELTGNIDEDDRSFSDWAEDWIRDNDIVTGPVTVTGADKRGKCTDIDMPDFTQPEVESALKLLGDFGLAIL